MPQETSTADTINQVAGYIEENASEPLKLDMIADQFDLSPFYLQKKFTEIFGISPKYFQNALRIQKFKQALKEGDDISGAIYEAGFGSTSRVYAQINQKMGITPGSYKKGGEGVDITFAMRETEFGHLIMGASERGVCFVHFGDSYAGLLKALHDEFPQANLLQTPKDMDHALDEWMIALERHMAGVGPRPQVPLHLYGTILQMKVWKFLLSIKDDATVSYKQVAEGIGSPKAHRAAASACGANKVAVLVPCHRVLRGDGGIGGYKWGVGRKEKLLEAGAA